MTDIQAAAERLVKYAKDNFLSHRGQPLQGILDALDVGRAYLALADEVRAVLKELDEYDGCSARFARQRDRLHAALGDTGETTS